VTYTYTVTNTGDTPLKISLPAGLTDDIVPRSVTPVAGYQQQQTCST